MNSNMGPSTSVTLSPEDAQALSTVLSRFNNIINWDLVANDMGVTEEVARQRYSRALSAISAPAPGGSPPAVDTAPARNPTEASTTSTTADTDTVATVTASNPPTASTTSVTAVAPQRSTVSELRPCVLPRLTGNHRTCCFHGYQWSCYAEGCVYFTLCAYDLRKHFRNAHPEQVATFDFSRLVHRGEQEARAWAEGNT